jgi:cell division protein FtsQ
VGRNRRVPVGGRGSGPRAGGWAVGAALTIGAGLALWPGARDAVRRHPYFTVREVVIGRHAHLSPARVGALAGIQPGMSIWDVDRAAAEERLSREPWVRSAWVRRELPGRIVIRVREHRPVAIVAAGRSDPGLYYVAAHGHVFAAVGPEDPRDFPYLTGLTAADLRGAAPLAPRALRRALTLLRLVERGRWLAAAGLGEVSEIHVDAARGLTLSPTRPPVRIELGWGGFEAKLARLSAVMRLWAGQQGEIAAVSLVFDDQVVVRTRPRPQPPAAGGHAART